MREQRVDLRMLLRHTLTDWRGWLTLGAFTLASALVSLLHPWPLALLIDHVLSGKPLPSWAQSLRDALPGAASPMGMAAYVAMFGIGLFFLDSTLDFLNSRAWIRTGQGVVYRLAARIFSHAQRLSIVRQTSLRTGDVLSTVTGDSWCVYSIASAMIFTPIQSLIMIGIAFGILYQIDSRLALFSLLIAPPMAIIAAASGRWSRLSFRGQRDSEAHLEAHVQQTLAGIPLVQSFAQEDRHLRELMTLSGAAIRAQRRAALVGGVGHLFSSLVTGIGSALVILLGARMALVGSMSVGDLLIFLAYLGLMHGEISNLLFSYGTIQHARASLGRIAGILAQPIDVESPLSPIPLPTDAPIAVAVEGVTFGYTATPILRRGTMHVSTGETVGLIGPSGEGKSTLALLIARMVDPAEGTVSTFGVNAKSLDLGVLRRNVRLVLQEPNIQSGTIRQILQLGDPNAPDDSLWTALGLAGLEEFVESQPEQLETEIGENGTTLSGGQQQRLSLARSLVGDPRILILDEPTSMLDAETEASVSGAILAHRQRLGLTTIIISHRDSSLRGVDRIYQVDNGIITALDNPMVTTIKEKSWR